MKRCSVAVEAYATALNDASTNEEMLALLRSPPTGPMPSGMPGMMPFLSTKQEEEERAILAQLANPGGSGKSSKKRSNSEENGETGGELDGEGEGGAKKKRKNKKKEVDPNAPKRPPSAYIVYQNDVRADVRAQHPDMKYNEILTLIGENWKALGESGQAAYKEKALKAMEDWKTDTIEYAANGKPEGVAKGDDSMAVDAPAAVKKEKAPKKEKKPKDAPAAAASTPAEKPSSSKAKPAAATSTPAAKAAPASKPAPASTKKNVPQAAAASSDSSSDDESSSDDDESD